MGRSCSTVDQVQQLVLHLGVEVTSEELLVWEVFGNVKWATGCLTQSRRHLNGQERSVELAVLGRLAAEMEYELLDLIDRAA